jgi:AcrR family transcriptional regulator
MQTGSSALSIRVRDEVATLKRERTIDVAAELFYERGYENTSLDVIAEHMGVTKPFIYAHFSSKAELLAEICSRGIASALDALNEVLSRPGKPTALLTELCQRFVIAVLHNQRHIAIFAREEKNLSPADFKRISDMRREFDARLVRLLDDGVAKGDFRVADTRMAALAIGGMVSWAYVWYRPDGRMVLEDVARSLTTLVLDMVGARRPRAGKPWVGEVNGPSVPLKAVATRRN